MKNNSLLFNLVGSFESSEFISEVGIIFIPTVKIKTKNNPNKLRLYINWLFDKNENIKFIKEKQEITIRRLSKELNKCIQNCF